MTDTKPLKLSRGMTLDSLEAELSGPQRRALAKAKARRDAEEAKIEAIRDTTREAVKAAIVLGVPPVLLAERLQITRSRVYQMRDEATSENIA